ncbi:MAG: MBL fold metallo-hydrolase [Chloroflexi bacterium]|nr:MBL fold metallo-hydrolase [Chloroflexota bacterium]
MSVEIRDIAPGLWLWRQPHWEWREGDDWEPEVSSFVVESQGDTVLLDPLAPHPSARNVWSRLDAAPPTAIVILKADHVRDIDPFVHWYGATAYGPWRFERGDAPRTELTPVLPGDHLPGGLRALYDGRGLGETPVYLPEQRALVFADGMMAPGGLLRVYWSPILEQATLPALHAMLDLPFEYVLVSHGQPVHGRADFEAALEREPWSRPTGA